MQNQKHKKLEVVEVDETPAYGLEAKVLMAMTGVIKCEQFTTK